MPAEDVRYVCIARLDGREHVFLGESGENIADSVVVSDDGFVLTFASEDAARTSPGVSSEAAAVYDLDAIDAWCASDVGVGECKPLLDAWNLFVDLPHDDNLFAEMHERSASTTSCSTPAIRRR